MKASGTPLLDPRDAAQVLGELLMRRPAYVPEWLPGGDSAAQALLQIFARYMQVVIERLNQAPDKNLLAFLDLLGISLLPAQAARAPVVFQAMPNVGDSRVPARTRIGAQVPGRTEPLVFETEYAIGMAAARLVQVVTVWPARDEYADHTSAATGGRPFTLFEPRQPVPHEIYLAHATLFAFTGQATVEIECELSTPGDTALPIAWEHWDGQSWRPFKAFDVTAVQASQDGTAGLTRSGIVTLRAACGESDPTTVHGTKAYWVRGRLLQALPPQPGRALPTVERIRLRTVIERPLRHALFGEGCIGDVAPDQAFADASKLDLSKTFFPFGRFPEPHSTFYFASDEVFGKIGAQVTLCFSRMLTPEEEADALGAALEPDVSAAATLVVAAARQAAQTVRNIAQSIYAIAVPSDEKDALQVQIDTLLTALNDLTDITGIDALYEVVDHAVEAINVVEVYATNILFDLFSVDAEERVASAASEARQAADTARTALNRLSQLSPLEVAVAGGAEPPTLAPPRLVWEYWNGQGWQSLLGPGDNDALNFVSGGELSFVVPNDLEPVTVNNVTARWLRVRLASGSFNRLRLVSWYDTQADKVNFFPILEPRPPALKAFFLGYTYRSPWKQPEHCLTYNDFQYENHSHDVRWPGGLFPIFHPVADTTPTLYLGFDRPLPNDLLSLYLDLQEYEATPPPLLWEAWDGTTWRALAVTDETAGLRRPGMVSFLAPDVAPRPQATVRQASGTQVMLSSALEAAVFQPGQQVVVHHNSNAEGEIVTVQQVQQGLLILATPLNETYAGGTLSAAALPRFGQPRDWLRARLQEDGAPARCAMRGLYLNAAWSVQVQTIENEVLGSGVDQPHQTLFFRQTPVLPGEQVEVRELESPRAEVELPILQEELRQRGMPAEHIRPVLDPRSGRVREVWVRWQPRPHLFFSGPDDRHYVVERARGRIIFGDGRNGRLPSVGLNNIRAPRYQAGGGLMGNVPAGALSQVMSGVLAQGVSNPRAAEGGADGEGLAAVRTRGPQTLRHRGRSLAARDYEALARAASPGVAAARVLSATAPNGRPASGWVTVIIVPQSQEPQPQPSYELRRQVHDYLAARAPATLMAERIAVIGPTYLPIGIAARVAPRDVYEARVVEERVRAALAAFLHPLSGGPEGYGWPFGRDVYLSDVAAVLEAVDGVDYASALDLLLYDTPQGEWVAVPPDRIVVAGPIRIEMQVPER